MKPVVVALQDEKASASQLLSAVKIASADVKLPALAEMAITRELSSLASSLDFDGYFDILRGSSTGVVKIAEIGESSRNGFIVRAVLRAISDLCRQEKKVDALAKCVEVAQKVVGTMDTLASTDEGKELLADLRAVGHLMAPLNESLGNEELASSKKLIDANKSHRLYKPFALFPTGQQVMQGVADALLARSTDAGFLIDLKVLLDEII